MEIKLHTKNLVNTINRFSTPWLTYSFEIGQGSKTDCEEKLIRNDKNALSGKKSDIYNQYIRQNKNLRNYFLKQMKNNKTHYIPSLSNKGNKKIYRLAYSTTHVNKNN